jgi:hypothetical protein
MLPPEYLLCKVGKNDDNLKRNAHQFEALPQIIRAAFW